MDIGIKISDFTPNHLHQNYCKFPYHNWLCVHVPVITSIALFHSAIIEHTNRVIYLEDDDVAAVDATGSKLYVLFLAVWFTNDLETFIYLNTDYPNSQFSEHQIDCSIRIFYLLSTSVCFIRVFEQSSEKICGNSILIIWTPFPSNYFV